MPWGGGLPSRNFPQTLRCDGALVAAPDSPEGPPCLCGKIRGRGDASGPQLQKQGGHSATLRSWLDGADPAPLPRRYALLRIVNVEKRRDSARGSRFLLELELQERGGRRLRLSEYVFLRLPGARAGDADGDGESPEPAPAASLRPDGRPELCRPLRLAWRQDVMVHFIVPGAQERGHPALVGDGWPRGLVGRGGAAAASRGHHKVSRWAQCPHPPPVKNQARWVVQFLADMAALQVRTGDSRFSVILVDFESEDMDVEQALRAARLPR